MIMHGFVRRQTLLIVKVKMSSLSLAVTVDLEQHQNVDNVQYVYKLTSKYGYPVQHAILCYTILVQPTSHPLCKSDLHRHHMPAL